jgi:hypothetical protein
MTSPPKHDSVDHPTSPKGWVQCLALVFWDPAHPKGRIARLVALGFWVGGFKNWLVALFVVGFGLYELAKQELSIRQWRQTQGTIVESQTVWLEQKKGSFSPDLTVSIRYQYVVGGCQYESTRITTGEPVLFYDVQQAAKYRKQHPPGATVTVLYAPYAPSEATLIAERSSGPWILLGFGIPFLLLVIYVSRCRRLSGDPDIPDVDIPLPDL